MKVLVISGLYPSAQDPLPGIYVQGQVQALARQGCQVKVLSPTPLAPFPLQLLSRKWAGYHAAPAFALDGAVEVHYPRYLSPPWNWFFGGSGQRMYAGIRKALREITRDFQFDLIHAHVALPDGYAAMKVAESCQRPYLVTIHGADLQKTIHFNRRCHALIGEVISRSAAAIFVSSKLKGIAEAHFGDRPTYQVVPNGIDPASLDLSPRKTSRQEGERKILLSVSNLIPSKGIDLNLYALERLARRHQALTYRVIGDGPERRRLEALSRKLGLSDQVEFLGQVPHDQVISQMADCDIFSLPSWQEGFGIVYLEAMAHGAPVIGCFGEGIEDFVVDGETGYLVKPRDSEGLLSVLGDLLDHPEKGIQTGKQAQIHVLENYTWESNARRMIDLYREIVPGG